MKEVNHKNKKLKIVLYILVSILILTIGVCSYLIVTDILTKKKDIIENNSNQEVNNNKQTSEQKKSCTYTVPNFDKIEIVDDCNITNITVENIKLLNKNVKINITYTKQNEEYLVNFNIGDKNVILPIVKDSGLPQSFTIIDNTIIVVKQNTGSQIGTDDITFINSEGKIIFQEYDVIMNQATKTAFTIEKYNMLDMACNKEEANEEILKTVNTYEIINYEVIKTASKEITCQEYKNNF